MYKFMKRLAKKREYPQQHAQTDLLLPEKLSASLVQNTETIASLTGNSSDFTVRSFHGLGGMTFAVVFIDGLTDSFIVNENIVKPLMQEADAAAAGQPGGIDSFAFVKDRVLTVGSTNTIHTFTDLMSTLYGGHTVILAEGWQHGISASSSKWEQRGVEEPATQTVIRGPKEGFTENIGTNVALLRRKIKSPRLWKIDRKIGRITRTDVSVMYINGIADDTVVGEVLERLDRIDTDSILESGYLEEFIQDKTFTPFPTMINTERPDSVAAALLEGQVALLVDGTPFVLLLPITFFKFFIASEDYYQRFDISSFLRILRICAFTISMVLPSIYIAVTTYHQEMIPTTLLVSLAAQREGIPFPAFFEALMMEVTFEVLREAGVRLPRAIGSAISIVGALVLGQAAVEAGLVSAAMVIVVAFTAISSFVVPAFNIAIAARLIRFVLMFLAATMGFFGIMSGLLFLIIHMLSIRSFGVPYLAPVAPLVPGNLKDSVFRAPWWMMITRPRLISKKGSIVRQKPKPRPDRSGDESERKT
ncbi:spore germination protein [Paenibacillus sp. N4]|uniref:spore germination protein n=1 Tax=Paenibacillus vietnamensis TaxID=2590547 RepID=UPI001CD14255|nr:spore germination protein [Paenibacillus vietnamensis]MCA0757637.1 spore germination protein [Paenibacillus vietnamensis]